MKRGSPQREDRQTIVLGDLKLAWYSILIVCLVACGYLYTLYRGAAVSDHQTLLHLGVVVMLTLSVATKILPNYFLRRKVRTQLSLRDVSGRLSVSEERARALIAERGIHASYIVGGHDFYDPADFSDAASLLRPTNALFEDNSLVRPIVSPGQTAELLVRPAESNE